MSPWGYDFSHRKITVSTAGLVPQMHRLGADLPVNLAVSLNASNDDVRSLLMPLNRTYPLGELLAAAQTFPHPPRKRITFEYILIRGVNDALAHARELTRRLRDIPCKINLIPFNEHPGVGYRAPEEEQVRAFQAILLERQFTAPVRYSKGSDIAAACGQLGASVRSDAPGTD
jgi:23S rRNA (adenine2503-C2)-methyltransferase